MKRLFVSYNKNDVEKAKWIAATLEKEGYSVIIQAWDFKAGHNFILEMQKAVSQCDKIVIVLSSSYLKSEYCQPEWASVFAKDPTGEKRLLIAVKVENMDLPGFFNPLIHVDFIGISEEEAIEKILCAVDAKTIERISLDFNSAFYDILENEIMPSTTLTIEQEADYLQAFSYMTDAENERKLGNFRKALEHYSQAEKIYRDLKDSNRLIDVLLKKCISENILDCNFSSVYGYLHEVRRLFVETGEPRDYAILTKLGAVSSRIGMFDDAMVYYQRAKEGYKGLNDRVALANVYRLMGLLEGKPSRNNIAKAMSFFNEAKKIYFSYDDLYGQAKIYQAIGDLQREHKNYKESLLNYKKSFSLNLKTNNLYQKYILMAELYRINILLSDKDGAEKWLEKIKAVDNSIPDEIREYIEFCLQGDS